MSKFLNSRRFRQGSVATAITIIVIALIVVANMVVSSLSSKFSLNLDLTENKIFDISEETINFLKGMNKDVDIYILDTEQNFTAGGEYFVQANEVISKYATLSPHVKVQYIDLVRNPAFASKFPKLQLSSSSVVVASGQNATDLTPYDLYNIETDPNYGSQQITSSKAEQAMTSAILKVTSDKVTKVSMLTGHNETELPALKNLLDINNYEVSDQNLVTEEINPEAKIAIITAPQQDFSDDELKKLDKFLEGGGKLGHTLLYFASDSQAPLPKLSAFLADWGIEVGNGFVFETAENRVINLNVLMPIVDYTEEEFSKTVKSRGMVTLIPYARPLKTLFETKSSITVTAPLMFSQTSGVVPLDAPSDWRPSPSDVSGPIPALIFAQKRAYEGTTPLKSNVVACGTMLPVEDSYLGATSLGNGDYFLSLVNTLAERDDIISIQSKAIGGGELGAQSQQVVVFGLLLVILLPLGILIFGIVVWLGRRHK